MRKVIVTAFVAIVFLSVGVIGIWYWGVPDSYIANRIEGLGVGPVTIHVEGFRKKILFRFNIDRVLINNGDVEIWSILRLSGGIQPLELLKGRAVITVMGASYGGHIDTTVTATRDAQDARISFSDIDTSKISYLRSMGFEGRGALSGSLTYTRGKGVLEFVVDDAELKGFSGKGFFVPLNYFHTVRGAAELVPPDSVRIKSLALSGEGIYVRVKGTIVNGLADLEIEVMPESSFPGNSLLMLIERYKVSEGYYYIPIKRHL